MKILRAYGIPDKLVKLIENMYKDTFAKLLTKEGVSKSFLILADVIQGNTLAPYLFIIVVDYVLRLSLEGNTLNGIFIKAFEALTSNCLVDNTDLKISMILAVSTQQHSNACVTENDGYWNVS